MTVQIWSVGVSMLVSARCQLLRGTQRENPDRLGTVTLIATKLIEEEMHCVVKADRCM